jgi:teichuronic acid biosynthesis glycosyltransferase TuaC
MNILLHVSGNTYPDLKIDHHTKYIWYELAKGFDEYHILARSKKNRFEHFIDGKIHLHLVPKITKRQFSFFFSSLFMFFLIKKYKITHILSQCPIVGGFSAILASKFYKIPCMLEINGEFYYKYAGKKGMLSKLLRYSFYNATMVRYANSGTNKFLQDYYPGANKTYIPYRVDTSIFNKTKSDFRIVGSVKLVSVGRFVWEKGYDFLIKVLSEYDREVTLTLVGGGPEKSKYLEIFSLSKNEKFDLELIDYVCQDELIDLIIANDIYIQTSVTECGPRTILEAMALRMPIISTKVGMVPDVIKNNVNGVLIDLDENGVIEAINRVASNDELRKNIAYEAYNDIKYDKKNIERKNNFKLYIEEILKMEY